VGRAFRLPVFDYLLLKLAARCNLNCTYCYWFRDASVYEKPKVLTEEAEGALLVKLEEHILRYGLKNFSILFHGGEPLLFGKARMVRLADALRELEGRTGCSIHLSITTNGVLIDDEWASVFRFYRIGTTLSIDGPPELHDLARVDHAGRGSYGKVTAALETLRRYGIEPGILAVCRPAEDPRRLVRHFVEELGIRGFDVLIPDATHQEQPAPIAPYYKELFDTWYDEMGPLGVRIRFAHALLKGVLGGESHLESIGYGPIQTCAMLTDGSLEPLDVLRIAGYQATRTQVSILTHTFQDVTADPVWRRAFDAASSLSEACTACEYRRACGGGFLPHRWSEARGYDNPSVYCADLKEIFDHVWSRVVPDLRVTVGTRRLPLAQFVDEPGSAVPV
jgi:uncharacterized protein